MNSMVEIDRIMKLLQDPDTDLEVVIRRARPGNESPIKDNPSESEVAYQLKLKELKAKERALARREAALDARDTRASLHVYNRPSYERESSRRSRSDDDTNYHN